MTGEINPPTVTLPVSVPLATLAPLEERIRRSVVEQLGDKSSPWMNLHSAAEYLDFPKKRLYNLVATNQIPHRKQGNRLLFNRQELDRWLDACYQGPSEFAS